MRRLSDRERAGLRDSVKTVTEDDGRITTEYGPEGDLLSWLFRYKDGSQNGASYTYDSQGCLLSVLSHASNGNASEKVYSYDEAGRLVKIADSRGDFTTFAYNDNGYKTETRILKKADEAAMARATGIDLMFADVDGTLLVDSSFGADATTFKTSYRDQDQPEETQVFDGSGALLGRLLRTFNDQGKITEVRQIIDNPMSMFPAGDISEMTARSGLSPDQIKEGMGTLMKFFGCESAKSYRYDARGRIESATIDGMVGTFTRTYSYNDEGDVVEENTVLARDKSRPVGVPFRVSDAGEIVPDKPPSEWPPEPDFGAEHSIRYAYKYDSRGNWIEKTVTYYQHSPRTSRRELTYY